jgi:hypothetical protein
MESLVSGAVFAALQEVNEQLPKNQRVSATLDTPLIGERAALDSLGLVNLIVCLEQKIEETTGLSVALGSDEAVFQVDGPMRSVESLIAHLVTCLDSKGHV